MSTIGSLNESRLHAQLKSLYRQPGGELEAKVGGFVVDVRNPDGIVEIQTGGLFPLRRKIEALLPHYALRIVHPVFDRTTIVRVDRSGRRLSRRASRKRGRLEHVFTELTYIADLLVGPTVVFEVPFVSVVEHRRDDGRGHWRRRRLSVIGRSLDAVNDIRVFARPTDFLSVLPDELPASFTHEELAMAAGLHVGDAQPITKTLRTLGVLEVCGRRGRKYVFRRT